MEPTDWNELRDHPSQEQATIIILQHASTRPTYVCTGGQTLRVQALKQCVIIFPLLTRLHQSNSIGLDCEEGVIIPEML